MSPTPSPRIVPQPKDDDGVQVLMTEDMARRFEERCLGKGSTVGDSRLSPPIQFGDNDIPCYIIEVGG